MKLLYVAFVLVSALLVDGQGNGKPDGRGNGKPDSRGNGKPKMVAVV